MKNGRQLFASTACALLMLGISAACAADDNNEFASRIAAGTNVVLFKVHDVAPIKNEDGVVTDCEFGVTLYNRSPDSVENALLNLSWKDEAISDVIAQESKDAKNEVNSLKSSVERKTTASLETPALTASINLPAIKPFRQVSLKSKIASDRCFLMVNDASFTLENCNIISSDTSVRSSRSLVSKANKAAAGNCMSLFKYVSVRDPEYYREFQKVSFNDEAKQRQEARKKDVDELQDSYKAMLENLNKITETLAIK